MAERNSLFVSHAGGIDTVEDARLGIGALAYAGASAFKAKSGFRPGPGTSPGLVTASGSPDANVHVAPFQLLLQSGRATAPGIYLTCLDATKDINILSTPADPTNARFDLVIAQQSDEFYGDGANTFSVKQVVGTPSGTPADPTVTGSADYVTLARVTVPANATTITSGNITDLRTTGHAKSLTGGLYSVASGGLLPVASGAQRDALVGLYSGLPVWRVDVERVEVYNGSTWLPFAAPLVPAVKTADEPLSTSTTLQDDDHLFLDLAANATYFVRLDALYDSGTTPGFKSDFTIPAGATCKLSGEGPGGKFTSTSLTSVLTWGGSASTARAELWGLVTTVSAGRLQWRWAQSTSSGTTTVRAGGVFQATRTG